MVAIVLVGAVGEHPWESISDSQRLSVRQLVVDSNTHKTSLRRVVTIARIVGMDILTLVLEVIDVLALIVRVAENIGRCVDEEIETTPTVVEVDPSSGVPAAWHVLAQDQRSTQPFSDGLDGGDVEHGAHGGSVFCSGIHVDLHILDHIARDARQLIPIAHPFVVDIDKRHASSQHADAICADQGQLLQHVGSPTQLAEHGPLYVCNKLSLLHLEGRSGGRDRHSLQGLLRRKQMDGHVGCCWQKHRLVSDTWDLHYFPRWVRVKRETAILAAYHASNISWVRGLQQGHGGIGNRNAVVFHHFSIYTLGICTNGTCQDYGQKARISITHHTILILILGCYYFVNTFWKLLFTTFQSIQCCFVQYFFLVDNI